MASVSTVDGPDTRTRPVELAVGGMSCAACATRVERKLNKLERVHATVNYATERATVHAPEEVDVQRLVQQVRDAGYTAEPVRAEEEQPDTGGADRVRYLWRRLVVALLVGVPVMDLSFTLALVPALRFTGWQWVVLALAAPVIGWCAWPFHAKAARAARHGASSMDTLVSLGIAAATCWSVYTMFDHGAAQAPTDSVLGLLLAPGGSVYLDVAVGVTIFVLAGRLFEAKAKRTAGSALHALAALGARDVAVLDEAGTERRVAVSELAVGTRFVVRPGETVAADGEVTSGASTVDTSPMTGESVPAEVGAGDPVTGGTVAVGGRIVVRATSVGADTQLAKLVELVQRAQTDKAAVQRLADRVSAVFVPVVCAIAALTFAGWMVFGTSTEAAFSAGLAVLIIACPCALGLATPTALLVASGRGAQLGMFLKGHQALESARAIDTVVLDKTGTVTTGRFTVAEVYPAADRAALLRVAGAVEDASEHVIARAVAAAARAECGELPEVTGFESLPGLGARGRCEGADLLLGSPRLLAQHGVTVPAECDEALRRCAAAGRTVVLVARDGVAAGLIAVADTPRPDAADAVAQLHALGLRTVLLTGDNQASAGTVAAELGIGEVLAEVLPADKAAAVERLQAEGRCVAMVGDGVNDAPALAGADLGLALVTGTDVAIGAADVILVRTELDAVPSAIRLARATLRTIRGNLCWAFGYNLAAIPIAAAGLLNPLISGAAMALSSLLVVSNSLRLRGFDRSTSQRPPVPDPERVSPERASVERASRSAAR